MEQIIKSLEELNLWMKEQSITGSLTYRAEISHMVRCGRSQISLNNSETGEKFFIYLQDDKKRASSSLTSSADDIERLKTEITSLWNKVSLMPEVPYLKPIDAIVATDVNKINADKAISHIDSNTMVELFAKVDASFKGLNVEISGAFSAGEYSYAAINTLGDKAICYQGSDYNAEVVVQLLDHHKKELRTSCVGEFLNQYHPDEMVEELQKLYAIKTNTHRKDIDAGEYDVIFASDAFAELTAYMGYLTFYGEGYEFEQSMLQKDKQGIGSKLFGENVTITDNAHGDDVLFARPVGINGIERKEFPLIENGVLKNMFYSDKDSCDRFNKSCNNDSSVVSIKMNGGDGPATFDEMAKQCIKPTVYISFIHYMNFTNAAKGEFTGTSRFGTFLIENGEVKEHLYNLRLNDDYCRIFNNIEWLSQELTHVNTSDSYDMRMASSIAIPSFVKVNGVKISGSSAPM